MILNLCGEVNYPMLDTLVSAINNLRQGDHLLIYFSSPSGGLTHVAEAIIDIINRHSEVISLFFYGENFSSGMYILLRTKCHKTLLEDTTGMFHLASQSINIIEGGNGGDSYDSFCIAEMKKAKTRSLEIIKQFKFNAKEAALIKRGKDAYFSCERLRELIDGK